MISRFATSKQIKSKNRFAYLPLYRKSFSIETVDGQLEKFQLRCGYNYSEHVITEGKVWHTPAEWGECSIQVYGDVGSNFKVIEHSA